MIVRHNRRPGRTEWNPEHVEYLRVLIVDEKLTATQALYKLKMKYPRRMPAWTRNMICGQASRSGFANDGSTPESRKHSPRPKKGKPHLATKTRGDTRVSLDRIAAHNVGLRAEGEPGFETKMPRKGKRTAEEIAQALIGHVPNIIDEVKPETSRLMTDSDRNDCKWPTSTDPRDMEVCGAKATVGAYCKKHAALAYRLAPTVKRNASFHTVLRVGLGITKSDDEDDAQWLADQLLRDDVIALVEHDTGIECLEADGED